MAIVIIVKGKVNYKVIYTLYLIFKLFYFKKSLN